MENPKKKQRKDRPKKRKFYGNRYTNSKDVMRPIDRSNEQSEIPEESICDNEFEELGQTQARSSSFQKLCDNSTCIAVDLDLDLDNEQSTQNIGSVETDADVDCRSSVSGYRLFRLECLVQFIQSFPCPSCFCFKELGDNFIVKEKLNGINSCTSFICKSCKATTSLSNDENVNLRFQTAMFGIGCHEKKGRRFLSAMDMPQPVSSVRASIFRDRILAATQRVAKDSMGRAAAELKTADGEKVTVSCDGSWHRRGFVSKNGVATCLSVSKTVPAKVIDTETLSNYCDSCAKMNSKTLSSDQLNKWKEGHQQSCQKNHDGSAGSMEPVGISRIFKRSEKEYGLKYTGYLGDGDSKSYKFVSEADPPVYNDRIEKLECCGHVQKRMGKRLLDKVEKCKGNVYTVEKKKIKGIGGAGKLTKAAIKRIQGHYGGAIRRNVNDLEKMKKAIWAIWYHRNGEHGKCDQWCDGSDKNKLPSFVMEEIRSVFEDLSEESLLKKCLHGGTQNANEAFHNLIWDRCPKTTFVGKDRLQIAVYDGTIVFNDGELQRCAIYRELGLKVGYHQKCGFRKLDSNRVRAAEEQSRKKSKLKRAERTIISVQEEDGEACYQAGAF